MSPRIAHFLHSTDIVPFSVIYKECTCYNEPIPIKYSKKVLFISILAAALAYIAMAFVSIASVPDGFRFGGDLYVAHRFFGVQGDFRQGFDLGDEALNLLYWNEPARTRYAFSDVEHYFIKYYGRFAIDYRQKPDAVVNDYTQLRIDALRGGAGGLVQAYSDLGDDGLLYALLQSYYRIGNLRNQVNHAQVDRSAAEGGGELKRKDSREDLDIELDKFIGLYSKACDKAQKSCEPLILEGGRLRGYVRKHELRPLEEETDLTQSSTVECEFDGKNVLINIRMLKPEADGE